MMLKDLPDVEMKLERHAATVTPGFYTRFCLHQGFIYLTVREEIKVYDSNNFLLSNVIKHEYLSLSFSTHPHTENHLLIASKMSLLRMTTDGQDLVMITRGLFNDVNVNGDIIAALGNGRVYIYTNTVPIKLVNWFKLVREKVDEIAIFGDVLYIACFSKGNTNTEIFNITGQKKLVNLHFLKAAKS